MSLHRMSPKEKERYKVRSNRTKSSELLNSVLDSINISKGTYLEVGAHNGVSASPTRHLLNKNWSAFFIEGDKSLYNDCKNNMKQFGDRTHVINQFISLEGENRLDHIIEHKCPFDKIDVLVIDIDSYDYWIFSDLEYRPPVIIIETNPYIYGDLTIPYGAQVDRRKTFWGASDYALYRLGKSKEYTCVGMSNCKGWNLFFVSDEIFKDSNLTEFVVEKVPESSFVLTHPGFLKYPPLKINNIVT